MSSPKRTLGKPVGDDLIDQIDTDEGFEDLYPTGEHDPSGMVELAGSDLEEISDSQPLENDSLPAVDDIPTPVALPSGFPPRDGTLPMPPQPDPNMIPGPPPSSGMLNNVISPAPFGGAQPGPPTTPFGGAPEGPPTTPFAQQGGAPDMGGGVSIDDDYDLGLEPLENAPTRIEREDAILGRGAGAPQQAGPQLVIIGGNNRGKEFPLQRRDNSLGRGMDNDVILADIAVSRKHTLICYEGNNFVLRDLGSGNGTLLNGLRMDSAPLKDGDQIEVGNTLIRFISPDHAAHVPPIASAQTVVTSRRESDDGPARKEGTAVSFAPRQGRPRRKKLLLFGAMGVVLFLGMMVGIKFLVLPKEKKPAVVVEPKLSPDMAAAAEWSAGIALFNSADFAKARTHFLKARALAPANDDLVRQYVEKTTAELKAEQHLEAAKKKLAAGEFKGARDELIKITYSSHYHKEAGTLAQEVDEKQVVALVTVVKELSAKGENTAAMVTLKQAQTIAPTNQDVKELYAALSSSAKGPQARKTHTTRYSRPSTRRPVRNPRPPQHRSAPKVSGRQAKEAISHYKQRRWEEARKVFVKLADSTSGKKKKQATSMAKNIQIVGKSWSEADKAPDLKQRLKLYLRALKGDRKISGGHHQVPLKDRILKATVLLANLSIKRSKYAQAFFTAKVGKKYCGDHPKLKQIFTSLEKKANEFFNMGYTVRTSNPARARKFWSKVIRMVPPTSDIYQKAYQYLNSAGPSYQDEDEE